ncbi:MAG TPA: ABC transporter permease [Vicinamibacterales bacterium]|nr:ABC transporter permease [Vicinamibacterales bacterium]
MQDLRYAFRNLRKSPGYAAVTVLTLALGIGANTAIFSVVNGVVLKPLPYPNPDRLVFITSQFPGLGFDQFWVSAPEYVEFADANKSFEHVGAYRAGAVNLGTQDQPRRMNSAVVTSELMPALGVSPLRGRSFTREDTLPGAEDVAILSSELWQTAFAGDEAIVGRVVAIDGAPTRIVGIMPPGYDIHDQHVQVWLPLTLDPANPGNRGGHFLYLVGRLREGVSLSQAKADAETLMQKWPQKTAGGHVPNTKGHRLRFDPLKDDMLGGLRAALWVLQGAVGFVLLIACANLANLLLARAESRQREFAIRSALGAGRWRLLRQFLTEGILLACVGGALGATLGFAGLKAMLAANPDSLPRAAEIALDPAVLAFTVLVSIGTGAVFGLAPLLHLRERVVTMALKESGQRSTAGAARTWVRRGLVMAEVALAVVLVIGAGLLLRSFWNLMNVDAGFNRSRLVTFGLVLPATTYREPQSVVDFFARLESQLASIPGVQSAAAMQGLPPQRLVNANDTDIDGYTAPPEGPAENIDYYQYGTVGYLTTMGIPVIAGRDFSAGDAGGPPVVLVNETLARTFFGDQSALGRRLKPGSNAQRPWFTIVGVVRDVKQGGVDKKTGTEVYFLADQAPRALSFAPRNMNFVVRSSLPYEALAGNIRRVVSQMDPTLPVVRMRTMDDVFAETISRPRFLAQLLGIFAGLALALAAIGTYGILSYSVSERRKEIGIHMAMGATEGRVLAMILGQGMRLAAVGLAAGVGASFLLTRLLQAQLFNVRPSDPLTVVAVVFVIGVVALLACYIPASRATRVDPMVVLRNE